MNKSGTSVIVIIASVIVIIAGFMSAQSIVLPIILALFISVILAQPILWMEKRKVPYWLGMIIVLVGAGLLFVLFGGIIGNTLRRFTQDAPRYEERLRKMTGTTISELNNLGVNINKEQIFDFLDLDQILQFTASAIGEIGKLMSDSLVILLITIFMLLEAKSFLVKGEVIEKMYGNSLEYLDKIGHSIRGYLSLKTLISLGTGIFIWIWLLIVGVDYAILWGVIAFLLNYIPNIGSIIAAVPTMLLALVQLGVGGMIWTGIGYFIVNTVMGNVVEPRVMGHGLGLSTLFVFLSLIIWGFMLGTVGMFLAVPLTMAIKIMLEQNEKTRWIAIMLGTGQETRKLKEKHLDTD